MRDRPWQIHPNALTNRIVTELISDVYQGSNGYYFRFKLPAARVSNHLFYFRMKFAYWIPLKWFDSTWNARNDFLWFKEIHMQTQIGLIRIVSIRNRIYRAEKKQTKCRNCDENDSHGFCNKNCAVFALVLAIQMHFHVWFLYAHHFYSGSSSACSVCMLQSIVRKTGNLEHQIKIHSAKERRKKKPQHRNDNERSKMTFQRCQNRNFARIVVFVVLVVIRPSRQSLVCC